MKKIELLFLLLCGCFICEGQNQQKIRFAREPGLIYFFQKGVGSDTIENNLHNEFYFLLPDTAKDHICLQIENGKAETLKNDSLIQISYLPGMRYESCFEVKAGDENKKMIFRTRVNGATDFDRRRIRVQLLNTKTGIAMMSGTYIWRTL